MPAPVRQNSSSIITEVYRLPSDIPQSVLETLRHDPRNSNLLLPYLEKALNLERQGATFPSDQFWIACFTRRASGQQEATLDFFLSCTIGPIGNYPLFAYSARPIEQLDDNFISPRMARIVDVLVRNVDFARIFSIFALEPVTRAFANEWSQQTGIAIEEQPYYSATFTFCTKQTLRYRKTSSFPGLEITLRQATDADLPCTAPLCYGFASESEPFVLSEEGAYKEAAYLTANKQLWVHESKQNGKTSIASIVAVTRETESVSAITKVYTNPEHRRRGCAERLVREVCHRLLRKPGKESVVLYVADTNPAAEKVYHRVGFAGLTSDSRPVPDVATWLELGFDQSAVQLGHW